MTVLPDGLKCYIVLYSCEHEHEQYLWAIVCELNLTYRMRRKTANLWPFYIQLLTDNAIVYQSNGQTVFFSEKHITKYLDNEWK